MAIRWWADDGPTLNAGLVPLCFFQGIWTSIAKKPYIFVIFHGGGGVRPPVSPPLDPPMYLKLFDQDNEILLLTHRQAAKAQTSMCICAVLLEPPLLAHTEYECR